MKPMEVIASVGMMEYHSKAINDSKKQYDIDYHRYKLYEEWLKLSLKIKVDDEKTPLRLKGS